MEEKNLISKNLKFCACVLVEPAVLWSLDKPWHWEHMSWGFGGKKLNNDQGKAADHCE